MNKEQPLEVEKISFMMSLVFGFVVGILIIIPIYLSTQSIGLAIAAGIFTLGVTSILTYISFMLTDIADMLSSLRLMPASKLEPKPKSNEG